MASGADSLQFVLSSSVRSDILLAVAGGRPSTDDLLDALDASSSAIYNALGRLDDAGLLRSTNGRWRLTGSGRLIADFVDDRKRLGSLMDEAGEYFTSHDARAVPAEYRRRMNELADASVIRAAETEPQSVVREVSTRLANAGTAFVVSPIYDELFERAMPDSEGSRVVLDRQVVDTVANELDGEAAIEDQLAERKDDPIRVTDANFALAVTESALLLSLPLLDGSYDARSEFVAEHDRALRWGTELFEHLWDEAVSLEDHVVETHL